MKQLILLYGLFLIFLSAAFPTRIEAKINQEKGIWQDQKEKQLQLSGFRILDIDFDNVPLKRVVKMVIYKNKIFMLDYQRSEIYVIDKKGKYLYTIGRPGQGPGDIEKGCDFYISNEKLYVLNRFSRRVEVFSIKGNPLKSIKLDFEDCNISVDSIAVAEERDTLIIGGTHEFPVAVFSLTGGFKKVLLSRDHLDIYKGATRMIGIPSNMEIIGQKIFHFDRFTGHFNSIDFSGKTDTPFNALYPPVNQDVLQMFEEHKNQKKNHFVSFTNWSAFCTDKSNRLYAVSMHKKKGKSQKMWVYSDAGKFLHSIDLDFFNEKKMAVWELTCDENNFLFYTRDVNLVLADRRN